MAPILSIIVPTKNRYFYLQNLILLIKDFDTSKIELVIQDNSGDNTDFLEFLNDYKESWIKYFYCNSYLTSVQNFDRAVINSIGNYVCFIGDDDAIVRNILEIVEFMDNENIEAARFVRSDYYWPEVNKYGSTLYFGHLKEKIEYLSPLKELRILLGMGCQDLCRIPLLYYGIVRRDILDKVYSIGKTFFPGPSADIANGVALCFSVTKYAYFHVPIVISGTSSNTGGGAYSKKNRKMELSEVNFISEDAKKNWEQKLPPVWSGTIVWPESAIKALRYMSEEKYIKYLNIDKVLASFVYANRSYFSFVLSYTESKLMFIIYLCLFFIKRIVKGVIDRIIRYSSRGRKCLGGNCRRNIHSIVDAERIISDCIQNISSNKNR